MNHIIRAHHFFITKFKDNEFIAELLIQEKNERGFVGTGEMKKGYGMIYVERYDDGTGNFSRRKKKSFNWYKKVITSNGEDLSSNDFDK